MGERRKNKRSLMEGRNVIKRLDNPDGMEIEIDVVDISKTGLGFLCDEPFEIGAVYQCVLTIGSKDTIHAFLQIVRIEMLEDGFNYGALFVGMPEIDQTRIAMYQTFFFDDEEEPEK